MSVQVGLSCYQTAVDAGQAACAAYAPVSNINGDVLTSITCQGIQLPSGALNLQVVETSLTTGGSSVSTVQETPAFPPCVQGDYIVAGEGIAGALLAAWAAIYGLWKVKSYLTWNRGDHV